MLYIAIVDFEMDGDGDHTRDKLFAVEASSPDEAESKVWGDEEAMTDEHEFIHDVAIHAAPEAGQDEWVKFFSILPSDREK